MTKETFVCSSCKNKMDEKQFGMWTLGLGDQCEKCTRKLLRISFIKRHKNEEKLIEDKIKAIVRQVLKEEGIK